MKKTKNDARYELTEMPGANRYWFDRDFIDTKHGRHRKVLVALEKAGWQGPDLISGLPWNLSIEDRGVQQTWKLALIKVNGEDRLVFERFLRTSEGIKEEIFELAYLPTWIVEEVVQVSLQMADRHFDGGINFLGNLVKKMEKEKRLAKAKLTSKVEELSIGGLHHIMSPTRGDSRGSFREVARFPEVELMTGYDFVGKQSNHSVSSHGVLRGFHVEPWAKLVTVTYGLAISYFLDCRPRSRTFGRLEKAYLGYGKTLEGDEITGGAIFIEPGIGNSVLTMSEKMDYTYVVDDLWKPDTALYAVNPMDPALSVPWGDYVPLKKITRSQRDMESQTFKEFAKMIEENEKEKENK